MQLNSYAYIFYTTFLFFNKYLVGWVLPRAVTIKP